MCQKRIHYLLLKVLSTFCDFFVKFLNEPAKPPVQLLRKIYFAFLFPLFLAKANLLLPPLQKFLVALYNWENVPRHPTYWNNFLLTGSTKITGLDWWSKFQGIFIIYIVNVFEPARFGLHFSNVIQSHQLISLFVK